MSKTHQTHQFSLNKKVLCAPFEHQVVETKKTNGFAMLEQKINFASTTVLCDFMDPSYLVIRPSEVITLLREGDVIFLDGELVQANWAKKTYEFNGKKCILVPYESIVLVETTISTNKDP